MLVVRFGNKKSIHLLLSYQVLFRCQVKTLGKLFTHMTCASVTKQYNLVPVAGQRCPATGKVTVGGLASHWPCVTDFSGLSTNGLMA